MSVLFSLNLFLLIVLDKQPSLREMRISNLEVLNIQTGQSAKYVEEKLICRKERCWKNEIVAILCVKHSGKEALKLVADDVFVEYEGELSNSRVPSHDIPIKTEVRFTGKRGAANLIKGNEIKQCQEMISLKFYPEIAVVEPGGIFHILITLEHKHFLYGHYDPLLGKRVIIIHLGPETIRAEFSVKEVDDRQRTPTIELPEIPEEKRSKAWFKSPPDSLYLTSEIPGFKCFRFNDISMPYNSKWSLSFWYFIAYGTNSRCWARAMEYQSNLRGAYSIIHDSGFEENLTKISQWAYFKKDFTTTSKTMVIDIDFGISEPLGEMWVDDIKLEPADRRNLRFRY